MLFISAFLNPGLLWAVNDGSGSGALAVVSRALEQGL